MKVTSGTGVVEPLWLEPFFLVFLFFIKNVTVLELDHLLAVRVLHVPNQHLIAHDI